jgi:MFS family permease
MSVPDLLPHAPARISPLGFYLAGSGAWFMSFGIQMVLFTYLATHELNLPGAYLGIAQASSTLPALFLLLIGGTVADQTDLRRILILMHTAVIVPPLILAGFIYGGGLTFWVLVSFGASLGIVTAFLMPAREAMLARVVPDGNLQGIHRVVRLSLLTQFVSQIVGMTLARLAHDIGIAPLLLVYAGIQAFGAYMVMRLPAAPPLGEPRERSLKAHASHIVDGLKDVARSDSLLPVTILTFAIGVFFVGSFMVILPDILRDDYGATVERVSTMAIAFWGGTISSTLGLGAFGVIESKGRMISIAVWTGVLVLCAMNFQSSLIVFYALTFIWGLGAGVTITTARTIIQEDAPAHSRARIMSVYQLGFTGGMPFGALISGVIIQYMPGRDAALFAAAGMASVIVGLLAFTRLWRLGTPVASPK